MDEKKEFTILIDGHGNTIRVRTKLAPKYIQAREEVLKHGRETGKDMTGTEWFRWRILREED